MLAYMEYKKGGTLLIPQWILSQLTFEISICYSINHDLM